MTLCFHVLVSLDVEVLLKGQNLLRTAAQWGDACSWEGRLARGSWELLILETCWFREWTWL